MSALDSTNRSHIGKISAFSFFFYFASFHSPLLAMEGCAYSPNRTQLLLEKRQCLFGSRRKKGGVQKGGVWTRRVQNRDLIPTSRTMFDSIPNPLRSVCITPFEWWFSYIQKRGLEHGVGCSWGGWCLLLRLHKGLSYVMNFYKILECLLSLPLGLS